MVSRVALLLLLWSGVARADLEFTPRPYEVEFEGAKAIQPGFRDGTAPVTFAPPAGWGINGSGSVLQLQPKDASSSFARVEARPLPAAAFGSEESLTATRAYLASLLPSQAQELKWEPEVERNPVLLNRHATLRLSATYQVLGQSFGATVLVCFLDQQQVLFTLTARERDFAKLYEEWRRSLFTWQGLK